MSGSGNGSPQRILVTGARGMVGHALLKALADQRPEATVLAPSRHELDLLDASATTSYLRTARPDVVLHAAGRVGGIADNLADPVGFLRENTALNNNLIGGALDTGVTRLLNFGSSCMFPRDWRQPLVEADLLQGELEPTNEGYALAKLAAERLCRYASTQLGVAYRTLLPSNLYGPHDHFQVGRSHLVAAAIAKVHRAHVAGEQVVEVWGDGTARREFTYVEDVTSWAVDVIDRLEVLPAALNVGQGDDHTVREYYERVAEVVGFDGDLVYDASRPTGMKQKLMDSGRARALGWAPRLDLREGLERTYAYFLEHAVEPDGARKVGAR